MWLRCWKTSQRWGCRAARWERLSRCSRPRFSRWSFATVKAGRLASRNCTVRTFSYCATNQPWRRNLENRAKLVQPPACEVEDREGGARDKRRQVKGRAFATPLLREEWSGATSPVATASNLSFVVRGGTGWSLCGGA